MLSIITTVLLLGSLPSSGGSTGPFRPIEQASLGNRSSLSEVAPSGPGLWHRGGPSAAQTNGEGSKGRDPLDQSRANEIRGESRESERRLTKFSELVLLPLGACLLLIMMLRRAIW